MTTYGYDAVSRLTSLASDLSGTAYDVSTSFTYNPAGQIASTTRNNDAYAWTGAVNVNRGYTTNGRDAADRAGRQTRSMAGPVPMSAAQPP